MRHLQMSHEGAGLELACRTFLQRVLSPLWPSRRLPAQGLTAPLSACLDRSIP